MINQSEKPASTLDTAIVLCLPAITFFALVATVYFLKGS